MAFALDEELPDRRSPGRGAARRHAPVAETSRAAVLRRVAAEVNANLELDEVFRDVLDSSRDLFGADVSGLWLVVPGRHPFRLAAHRGVAPELVDAIAKVTGRDQSVGLRAVRERRPIVLESPAEALDFSELYTRLGFRTVTYVPLLYRDEPVGLLVQYHRTPYAWTPAELALCATFANQMATAVANARLFNSVRDGAARLRAIQELSLRLNRIQDVEGIGDAIVAESDRLIAHDTIRVYRVDQATGTCEPVAFQGEFMGTGRPSPDLLRVRVGEGLTGWVALHNETIRLGDATGDPRARLVGASRGPESMLLVPMAYESRVMGVIVVSTAGYDRYSDDDQRTLEIFAAQAAQAMVNAEAFAQVHRQQEELQYRLESQRRLLEVNERLLATLDPGGVLEMIADSLKAVVAYDALTIYRVDRAAGIRRAVVARDQYADLILSHEGPLDGGITGWAIGHGEAVLANDAHLDPRSVQIPGTPEEPESMIVCPLQVAGQVIGTLNVARMGGVESHYTRDEFELVQLFAAQASIALRNAEAHGAVMTRAEHDALTGLRNHGAFQRELGALIQAAAPFALLMLDLDDFKAYNDRHGHPVGDALLTRVAQAMTASIRTGDRAYRYGGDEFAILLPGIAGPQAHEVAERVRAAVAQLTDLEGPPVTISAGPAIFPLDGRTNDEIVGAADRALYLAKPAHGRARGEDPTRDPYLAAVDHTTLGLLEHLDPAELLREVVDRASALVGVANGFLYLLERDPGGDDVLAVRVGTGLFAGLDGCRLPVGTGISWEVVRTGRPVVVDDYAVYPGRAPDLDASIYGAVCGVPLMLANEAVGSLGLASGDRGRQFSEREVQAVARFARLAAVALDHARLLEQARTEGVQRAHAARHDLLTGLPNRSQLLERLDARIRDLRAASDANGPRSRLALIVLDLDRFTVVNESLGHGAGDLLLAQTGARLARAARPSDLVARLGSDEFAVLLGPVRGVREAERIADRIEAVFARPFDLGGTEVAVDASLGLAVARDRGHVTRGPAQGGGDRAPSGQGRRRTVPGPVRSRRCVPRAPNGPRWSAGCGEPSSAASCACTTSPWSTSQPEQSSQWRPCSDGSTRIGG